MKARAIGADAVLERLELHLHRDALEGAVLQSDLDGVAVDVHALAATSWHTCPSPHSTRPQGNSCTNGGSIAFSALSCASFASAHDVSVSAATASVAHASARRAMRI